MELFPRSEHNAGNFIGSMIFMDLNFLTTLDFIFQWDVATRQNVHTIRDAHTLNITGLSYNKGVTNH
jgi:hypothetical protein